VLGVFVATMPYSAIVGVAYAPLVLGLLTIAAFARRAKSRRGHY
jgi:hypothetical protein